MQGKENAAKETGRAPPPAAASFRSSCPAVCRKELPMQKKEGTDAAAQDRGERVVAVEQAPAERTAAVRNHKDTIFRMLFRDKKRLLELYNALNGTEHSDEGELEVFTLENAIYMNMKNDVSLLFDGELHLYEHQASVNPNLPLRDLSYVTRQLERYTKDRPLYGRRLVKIPEPRFVAFYNGTEEQPEQRELKLSDSFLKKTDQPEMELKVQMININYGKNRELMKRSRSLEGYSILVDRIRNHAKEMPMAEAVDRAVSECIREGILSEFLSAQRAEVKAVSIFEYDEEEEREKLKTAYMREGISIGEERGKTAGIADSVLTLLASLGEPNTELTEQIRAETDTGRLPEWLRLAAKATSLADFQKQMKA